MALNTLQALLTEQLRDIYYAEKHLVKALPKMARAAGTAELKAAFTEHATQTEGHVARLEQAFEILGLPARGKKCPAIEGLIQEAAEMMAEKGAPEVVDAGLIASAQRVEHYEMAAYGSAKMIALALGHPDVAALLDTTLHEEHAANKSLNRVSTDIVMPSAALVIESAKPAKPDEAEDEDATPLDGDGTRVQMLARAARPRSQQIH
jgi:ferritin-like metal-binding protein YciE